PWAAASAKLRQRAPECVRPSQRRFTTVRACTGHNLDTQRLPARNIVVVLNCQTHLAPGFSIPQLDVVVHSGDDHLAVNPGELSQVLRQYDTPLPVRLEVGSAGKNAPPEGAHALVGDRPGCDAFGHFLPLRDRVDHQVPVEAACHDQPSGEFSTEAGGYRYSPLVVDGVRV